MAGTLFALGGAVLGGLAGEAEVGIFGGALAERAGLVGLKGVERCSRGSGVVVRTVVGPAGVAEIDSAVLEGVLGLVERCL